jgi:hypothetical protein
MTVRFSSSDDSEPPQKQDGSPEEPENKAELSDSVFLLQSSDTESASDGPFGFLAPLEFTFRFNISHAFTLHGHRTHFQLARDGIPLFHSKLKSRRPNHPIGISIGFTAHFSQQTFAGFLYPKDKDQKMMITSGSPERTPLMSVEFRNVKGPFPKHIECVLIESQRRFVSRKPVKDQAGHWSLSFGGKIAIPSVKNCVLVDAKQPETIALRMRRVSEVDCELDSFGVFEPLLVFGYGMAAFISRV